MGGKPKAEANKDVATNETNGAGETGEVPNSRARLYLAKKSYRTLKGKFVSVMDEIQIQLLQDNAQETLVRYLNDVEGSQINALHELERLTQTLETLELYEEAQREEEVMEAMGEQAQGLKVA